MNEPSLAARAVAVGPMIGVPTAAAASGAVAGKASATDANAIGVTKPVASGPATMTVCRQ